MSNDCKFQIGNNYQYYDINGDIVHYTVVYRNEKIVTMKESYIIKDSDTTNVEYKKYEIIIDPGVEKILIWENQDKECFLLANDYLNN